MHPKGLFRHIALRIDILLIGAARRQEIIQLDTGNLNDAVAGLGVEARGFRVERDLTHGFSVGGDRNPDFPGGV